MLVRMRHHISGGRADGRPWPVPVPGDVSSGLIEVSDTEGADLVRGEMAQPGDPFAADRLAEMGVDSPFARYVPEVIPDDPPGPPEPAFRPGRERPQPGPGPAAVPPPEVSPLAAASPVAEVAGGHAATQAAVFAPEVPSAESPGTGPPPAPGAPKQAWIDYAVTAHGADVHAASNMTKADLMSRYGGRM